MKSSNKVQTENLSMSTYLSSIKKIAKIFVRRKCDWSIGIYTGESPFKLSSQENIKNPVLTAKDVIDVSAEFVADPFMVYENGTWYMFFEVMNIETNRGEIGLATSTDGIEWNYQKIILRESFHLSYPYVFKWDNSYYMVPESNASNSIRLYQATDFPEQWSYLNTLIEGQNFKDSSVVYFQDKWWLFTTTGNNDFLRLYYAESLTGKWIEHPKSPIIQRDFHIARPGGRMTIFDNKLFRYSQDCQPFRYGNKVRAFEITELSTTNYSEKSVNENPIIGASGYGWNADGMHNIDPHIVNKGDWIACVDGYHSSFNFGFNSSDFEKIFS
jgi:hypothetical protein